MLKCLLETVSGVAAEVAAGMGVEIYHLELSGRTLRVLIDAPGGVSLETCTRVSRALSSELDRLDIPGQSYLLEVSSPGIERQLYRPRDYIAAVGRNVLVRTTSGVFEGTLASADAAHIKLTGTKPDAEPTVTISYSDIRSCRVKVADQELFPGRAKAKVEQ